MTIINLNSPIRSLSGSQTVSLSRQVLKKGSRTICARTYVTKEKLCKSGKAVRL